MKTLETAVPSTDPKNIKPNSAPAVVASPEKRTAPKRKAPKVNPDETPEQAFARLATKRVKAFAKRARHVANLGGPGYKSSDKQKAALLSVVDESVKAIREAFDKGAVSKAEEMDFAKI